MKPFRFVHMADVHLDTSFHSREDTLRQKLRDALRQAFKRGVDLAIEKEVDCLMIAGDLFDNDRLSFATQRFLLEQLERLNTYRIRVFYATGNHDPGQFSDRLRIKWPDNVVLFHDGQVRTEVLLDDAGSIRAKITACGHHTHREGDNFAAAFPKGDGATLHIGLLHTMAAGSVSASGHERYAPCAISDLEATGYDYWALGHIHQRQSLNAAGTIQYPGNIQGRHPGETEDKGCLLVEIYPGSAPKTTFYPLSSVTWHWLKVDRLETTQDLYDLLSLLEEQCAMAVKNGSLSATEHLFRIELIGRCPMFGRLQDLQDVSDLEQQLVERVQALSVEILCDDLHPPINVEVYRTGTHVLATVLEWIDKAESDPDFLRQILPSKLACSGKMDEKKRLEYIQGLLVDLREEAVVRLVGEER